MASASRPSGIDVVALQAAIDGDLCLLKEMADKVNLHEAKDDSGRGVLHFTAGKGHLELCRFLVEELGLDVNSMSAEAATKDKVEVVKILLEHGADPNKVVGNIYSPLMVACLGHSLNSMKLLVKAGADVNFVVPSGRSILVEAILDGSIDIVKFLLEARSDPNFVDNDGKIPIMYAAVNGQCELVEILFPKTRPVSSVPDWSVDVIITSVKDLLFNAHDAAVVEERIADSKSQGKEAFAKEEYLTAVYFYGLAMEKDPSDATLFANLSLCWLRLRDGDQALSNAQLCMIMRPGWSKAWYRQGAALSFLKDYKGAVVTFEQALKLDPVSDEIKKALSEFSWC